MDILQLIENEQLKKDIPDFRPGDTVRVHVRVVEAERERIQIFEGVVIARSGGDPRRGCGEKIPPAFPPSCEY